MVDTAHILTEGAGTLGGNLSCDACGYNLRGLTTGGRCPECGLDVAETIRRARQRLAGPTAPDGEDATSVVEGACCLLASLGLLLLVAAAFPEFMFRRWSPGRFVTLVVLSVAWVSWGYGAWKLCVPAGGRGAVGAGARIGVLLYFIVPFVWAIETIGKDAYYEPMVSLFWRALCGLAVAVVLPLLIALLFRRLWRTGPFVEALVSALATPASLCLLLLSSFRFGPGSLDALLSLPHGLFLSGELLVYAFRDRAIWREPLFYVVLALTVWNVTLVARLAWAYRPYMKRGASGPT